MSNPDLARYLDAGGVPHTVEVRPLSDGGWAVIDVTGTSRETIDTLTGVGDTRAAAVALAHDYAAQQHHDKRRRAA